VVVVLRFTSFGSARAAVRYFVDQGADCARTDLTAPESVAAGGAASRAVDYYGDSGRTVGQWLGSGAAALGLTGAISSQQVLVLTRLLSGQLPDSTAVSRPVLRPHPDGRLPAAPLLDAVHAAATERGLPVEELLGSDDARGAFARLSGRVDRDPTATVHPQVLADVAGVAGVDVNELYGAGRVAVAFAQSEEKVDARRAGVDGSLSAPKSVSVLWALADSCSGEQVLAAHRAAVTETVAYLERYAGHALRGHQGDGQRAAHIGSDGLIVAAFEHHTSRADDPQLHTHLVIANLLHGTDGRWSALDTRALFRVQRTAGYLYQAVLRGQLTSRLGVTWGRVRNGTAEIQGLPVGLLREFSRRRQAIEAQLEATGRRGVGAAQVACLQTRPAKSGRSVTELLAEWWHRAQQHLDDPTTTIRRLLHRELPIDLHRVNLASCAEVLFGADGVTAKQSSFDRGELTRALLEILPAGTSLDQARLDRIVDGLLRDPRVLPLLDTSTRRWTTRDLAGTELAALHLAAQSTTVPVVAAPHAQTTGLSAEQAAAVAAITASRGTVDVLLGPAGAGKTALLAALHRQYQDIGVPVAGVCVAAIAARRLQGATRIASTSVARLTAQLRGGATLPPACVLVVDEAGMVGTRDYHQLLTAVTAAGGKLVAVGDRAQLTEIDAGGMFARLSRSHLRGELTDNHRQVNGWERDALVALRSGDILPALRNYAAHDRLHQHADTTTLRDTIAGQYVAAIDAGATPFDVVALAGSRNDAAALNIAIRQRLRSTAIGADQPVGDRKFAVGEVVLVTRNDHPRALLNGTRGVITAINSRQVSLHLDDDRQVAVPTSWAAERLRSAYAMTVHKAQGLTVDVALVDVTGLSDRNSAYVAASRARRRTALHYTDLDQVIDTLADDPFTRRPTSAVGAAAGIARRIRTHRQQQLAVDQNPRWPRPTSRGGYRYDPYEHSHGRDAGMSR
jgi:conjugative relaxase-like TrwC/TraI family protein